MSLATRFSKNGIASAALCCGILLFALFPLFSSCSSGGGDGNADEYAYVETNLEQAIEPYAAICLAKLKSQNNYDVFFAGDSNILRGGFETDFAEYNCANLGVSSSTIKNWIKYNRFVEPGKYGKGDGKKLFLMVGVNSLILGIFDDDSVSVNAALYDTLIKEIKYKFPNLKLYLHSVLPVSKNLEWSKKDMLTQNIKDFNKQIERIAAENGATFIDLYPLYSDGDGWRKEGMDSGDGLHLAGSAYSIWYDAVRPYLAE